MKTCHIYFYDGWLSVSPTTIGVAKVLGKYFEKVIIYAQNTQFKKYFFKENNIEVQYIYNSFYWKKSDKPRNFFNKVVHIFIPKIIYPICNTSASAVVSANCINIFVSEFRFHLRIKKTSQY